MPKVKKSQLVEMIVDYWRDIPRIKKESGYKQDSILKAAAELRKRGIKLEDGRTLKKFNWDQYVNKNHRGGGTAKVRGR